MMDREQQERTAFAAIGALGRREIDAVKAWIASGCEGVQPKPDRAARERLAAELNVAIAARPQALSPIHEIIDV